MITMRAQCKCGSSRGYIETRNGQDCVFCWECRRWQYNAPKVETGRAVRTVSTVHAAISPKLRASILMRATGRCELCGASPTAEHPLHVGHLIAVKHALSQGLTDLEINDPENMAAMCDECNLGVGCDVVPLRLAVAIVLARLKVRSET